MPARAIVREPGGVQREVPVPPGEPLEILPGIRATAAEVPGLVLVDVPHGVRVGGRPVPVGERWLLAPGEVARIGPVRLEVAWEDPGTEAGARAVLLAAIRGEEPPGGPSLVARGGPLAGRSLRVRDGVLGRGPDAAVPVADPTVSRSHLRLSLRADGVLHVEDLGSRNGTWVGGRPIRRARPLRPGEPFRAGRTVLALALQDGGPLPPWPPGPTGPPRRGRPVRVRLLLLAAAIAAAVAAALAAAPS